MARRASPTSAPTMLIERLGAGPGGGDRRLPGHRARTTASRRSGAAAPTPAPSRSPRRSARSAATSIPTSTASIRPTRASSPKARRLDKVAFEEMLEMASLGSKVLQVRSVELAMVHGVRTFVRSSFDDPDAPQTGRTASPSARSFATRTRSWKSSSLPASPIPRTRPRSRSAAWRTSRASPRRSSGRSPRPASTST